MLQRASYNPSLNQRLQHDPKNNRDPIVYIEIWKKGQQEAGKFLRERRRQSCSSWDFVGVDRAAISSASGGCNSTRFGKYSGGGPIIDGEEKPLLTLQEDSLRTLTITCHKDNVKSPMAALICNCPVTNSFLHR